jgi:hypothetical protein
MIDRLLQFDVRRLAAVDMSGVAALDCAVP